METYITLSSIGNFNPRTREGCDGFNCRNYDQYILFQSTHPRGVRLDANDIARFISIISIHAPARGATPTMKLKPSENPHFNPRTREGCDILFL